MSTGQHPMDQEELMAFLDGELPAERAAGAAEHLKHCADCQQLARDFSQVSQVMVGWGVEETSTSIPLEVSLALDEHEHAGKGSGRKLKGLPAWREFVGWPQFAWTAGLAVATLLIIAVSVPSLMRSKEAAEQSVRAARLRQEAERQQPSAAQPGGQSNIVVSKNDLVKQYATTTRQLGPEYGRNSGSIVEFRKKLPAKPAAGKAAQTGLDNLSVFTADGSASAAPPPVPPATPVPNTTTFTSTSAIAPGVFAGSNYLQEPARGPAPKQNAANNQQLAQTQSGLKGFAMNKVQSQPKSASETVEVAAEAAQIDVSSVPMIIRTAQLAITTKDFESARARVEEILKRHQGYVGELNVNTPTGAARSLTGTLRVPATQLEAAIADLKAMGRVEQESQNGEEVTQQYVDLEARIKNSRNTEQRLIELQRERTGKLSDVLSVEMQISRVRGEIEQMEAQRKTMRNQVDYATVNLTVSEDYKAELKVVPPSTSTLVRNAAVEGYKSLVDGLLGLLLWLLSWLPSLLVWIAVLFFPARVAWRRLRQRFARQELAV